MTRAPVAAFVPWPHSPTPYASSAVSVVSAAAGAARAWWRSWWRAPWLGRAGQARERRERARRAASAGSGAAEGSPCLEMGLVKAAVDEEDAAA